MKAKFILLVLMLVPGIACKAQTKSVADSVYIVTYTTGTAWDHSKPASEQLYFKEHSANLSSLRKAGVIKAGARYGEKGIIFISAATLTRAKEIIEGDLAVVHKLFDADVQKLSVFYEGCLERQK